MFAESVSNLIDFLFETESGRMISHFGGGASIALLADKSFETIEPNYETHFRKYKGLSLLLTLSLAEAVEFIQNPERFLSLASQLDAALTATGALASVLRVDMMYELCHAKKYLKTKLNKESAFNYLFRR